MKMEIYANEEEKTDAQVWDAEDYVGKPNKFLSEKPKKLVFDEDGFSSDITWRYILHNDDVVLYSVTLRFPEKSEVGLEYEYTRIIAFFYKTDGIVRPRAKKSELQRKMSRNAGMAPDYKQISLPTANDDVGGWVHQAVSVLGFFLNDTRWPV